MKTRQDRFFVTSILCILLVLLASCAQQPPRVARVGWMSIATPTAPALKTLVRQAVALNSSGKSKPSKKAKS